MSRITNLFAKNWRNVHIAAIILLSALLIITPSLIGPTVNQVVLGVFHSPFATVKNVASHLMSVNEVNEQLRQELAQASVKIAAFEEAARENKRLRSVLGFEEKPGYHLEPAEIISVSRDYYPVAATINRGSNHGIELDQAVINQQGLIGRISSVSADFATVQLLTDPANRVASRVADSREMGITKFTVSEGMILDNFPIQGTIKVGDTVLSSGLGGVYPAGLKVGYVWQVERPELEPFCEIRVEPAVNFHSLDELFVLMVER